MSIEYFAKISPGPVESLSGLAIALQQNPDIQVDLVSADHIQLSWRTSSASQSRFDDVTISRDDGGVLLSFHTATRQQRQQLLLDVESRMTRLCGQVAAFEEL